MPREFVCTECGHKARDNYNLTKHTSSHVSVHLKCRFCKSPHSSEAEARAHEDTCKKCVMCFHCHVRVRDKNILISHIKTRHATTPSKKPHLQCPLCSNRFGHCYIIDRHLSRDHHMSLEKTHLNFDNEEIFYKWKADLESSSLCAFTKRTAPVSNSGKRYMYFNCYRSGSVRMIPIESRIRRTKLIGTHKMNAYCPARVAVRVERNGKVDVTYVATHVGHDFEIKRLRLSKLYRKSLAIKMKMKIPLDEILASEREKAKECSKQQLNRSLFLTRKDLHNIARDFGVRNEVVFHQNDAVGDQTWIKEELNSEPPWVRYYEFNEDIDPAYPEHNTENKLFSESNPSIVIEKPNDDFLLSLEDPSSEEIIENSIFHEIVPQPTSFSQNLEETIMKFVEVARKARNDEQLAAVNKAVLSLDATISELQQTEASPSKLLPSPAK